MEKEVIMKRILQAVTVLLVIVLAVLLIMDHLDNKKLEAERERLKAEIAAGDREIQEHYKEGGEVYTSE